MDLKRELKSITLWTRISKWSTFHDLRLYSMSQSNQIWVSIVLIIQLIQRLDLVFIDLPHGSKYNQIHSTVYQVIAPPLTINRILTNSFKRFSLFLAFYTLIKLILTLRLFYVVATVKVTRYKNGNYLKFVFFSNFLDLNIFGIAVFSASFHNIYYESWPYKLISGGIILILAFECLLESLFAKDFKFEKRAVYQGRDQYFKIVGFFNLLVVTAVHSLAPETQNKRFRAIVNILHFLFGVTILCEFFTKLHFLNKKYVYMTFLVTNLLYVSESAIGIFFTISGSKNAIDADMLIIVVFMLILSLTMRAFNRKIEVLLTEFVYDIKSVLRADQYLEKLALLFKRATRKREGLAILSIMRHHYRKCSDMRCLCFLLKFAVGEHKEKRLVDHMLKYRNEHRNDLKLILYDDKESMEALKEDCRQKQLKTGSEEVKVKLGKKLGLGRARKRLRTQKKTIGMGRMSPFATSLKLKKSRKFHNLGDRGGSQVENGFLINLHSDDVTTVFASFYHILLTTLKGDKYRLFTSYLSYLIYEVENFVGCLINCYNFIFSVDYRNQGSIFTHYILQNYIQMSSKKLHQQFLHSPYWLSETSFFEISTSFSELDTIESRFMELVRIYVDFYQELIAKAISLKELTKKSQKMITIRAEIEAKFRLLFAKQADNSRLVSLYINYQMYIKHVKQNSLREMMDKLNLLVKKDRRPQTLEQLKTKNVAFNVFSDVNMIVFVNILKSRFYISNYSSNLPKYFDYEQGELKGALLTQLMPDELKRKHDRYVMDFVNQKKHPICRTGSLTTFSETKFGELRMVSVISKLEYFLTSDVYICGIIIPHPRNNNALLLMNNSGKILGMNQKSRKVTGDHILDNPYSLFLSVPLLLKFFYPEVQHSLRYKNFRNLKKEKIKAEKEAERGAERRTKEFDAFMFKYMLTEKFKTKGIVKGSKFGILSNFGLKNSAWQSVSMNRFSPRMFLPKHIRFLASTIAKNRELCLSHYSQIYEVGIALETFKHRGGLTLKLVVITQIKRTDEKVKRFFRAAARNLKGGLADAFMVHPCDIMNLCKNEISKKFKNLKIFAQKSKIFLGFFCWVLEDCGESFTIYSLVRLLFMLDY